MLTGNLHCTHPTLFVASFKVCNMLCSKSWSRDLVDAELDALVAAFKAKGIARVSYKRSMACVSLICNVQRTSEILERVSTATVHALCFS